MKRKNKKAKSKVKNIEKMTEKEAEKVLTIRSERKQPLLSIENDGVVTAALVENAEAQLLTKEAAGQVIDKLAYKFTDKKGNEIQGLTYWGYVAATEYAKKDRWKPVFGKPEFTQIADSAGRMLVTISVTNPKTGQVEYGTCAFVPSDRFDERSAMTRAKKYALDKMIPLEFRLKFIGKLVQTKPESFMQLQPPKTQGEARRIINPAIASKVEFAKIFACINDMGIDVNQAKDFFHSQYNIKSLTELDSKKILALQERLKAIKESPESIAKFKEQVNSFAETQNIPFGEGDKNG